MSTPLVSVVILNYKRLKALEQAIDSVVAQEYPCLEIIVVDNHSEEDIESVVRGWGADIKLIELPENRGACGGRNAGIRAAKGDIVVTLDNDVSFASRTEVAKIARKFEERADVHVLAFRLVDADTGAMRLREWCHPRSWKEYGETEFETHFFVEGSCAYRRDVFDVCGDYYEPLFIYCEGYDLALRVLDHGFRILYTPSIRVYHLMASETRTRERGYYFFTRNYIWIAYKNYRPWDAIRFLTTKLGMMAVFTLRSGHYRAFFRGLRDGVAGLRRIAPDRTPVSKTTVRYLGELERWRPSWIFRLARHRTEPQL